MRQPAYARVAVPGPLRKLFDYAIPEALRGRVQPGCRVRVPFGRRSVTGVVVRLSDQAGVPKTKPIASLVDATPPLSTDMLSLGMWMAERYCCGPGEALSALLPTTAKGVPRLQRIARLVVPPEEAKRLAEDIKRKAPRQAEALLALTERSPAGVTELRITHGVKPPAVLALADKGLVEIAELPVSHRPRVDMVHHTPVPEKLTAAQQNALSAIEAAEPGGGAFLLHGVTASGKTEVYLRAIEKTLAAGRTAICLVPEISLTPQALDRFTHRFGDAVAVRHSRLTPAESRDEWERVRSGKAKVVVGARSAVFAPLADLGLIVIDEEHETSYKQEDAPRYHAREVALRRAASCGATVILGTATPSMESYNHALEGRLTRLVLPQRVDGWPPPTVEVVDMRQQWRGGGGAGGGARSDDVRGFLSEKLQGALEDTLRRGRQAMLFLNRRGLSTFVHCPACGWHAACPVCLVSYTYHRNKGLRCHYCGRKEKLPTNCPSCGCGSLRYSGAGAQKVETELRKLFPAIRVARMDSDAMRARHAFEDTLAAFRAKAIDVLVGTQMIAKGLDFPDVALVGIVSADTALRLPDFRSAERTFQLIAQMAGRGGRSGGDGAADRGRVIVQTYEPEHYAIRCAAALDYEAFAEQELGYRREVGYPPYRRMVLVTMRGEDEARVEAAAERLTAAVSGLSAEQVEVLGPGPAPLAMIRGRHRWHLTLIAARDDVVGYCCQAVDAAAGRRGFSGVTVTVDVDPVSTL